MKKGLLFGAIAGALLAMSCSTVEPFAATSNEVGSKVGISSAGLLFGVLPIPLHNDFSIQTAAKNGGITKISTVDVKEKNYFCLWFGYETIVTGE